MTGMLMTFVCYWYLHNLIKHFIEGIEREANLGSYENYLENILGFIFVFSDELPLKHCC